MCDERKATRVAVGPHVQPGSLVEVIYRETEGGPTKLLHGYLHTFMQSDADGKGAMVTVSPSRFPEPTDFTVGARRVGGTLKMDEKCRILSVRRVHMSVPEDEGVDQGEALM